MLRFRRRADVESTNNFAWLGGAPLYGLARPGCRWGRVVRLLGLPLHGMTAICWLSRSLSWSAPTACLGKTISSDMPTPSTTRGKGKCCWCHYLSVHRSPEVPAWRCTGFWGPEHGRSSISLHYYETEHWPMVKLVVFWRVLAKYLSQITVEVYPDSTVQSLSFPTSLKGRSVSYEHDGQVCTRVKQEKFTRISRSGAPPDYPFSTSSHT